MRNDPKMQLKFIWAKPVQASVCAECGHIEYEWMQRYTTSIKTSRRSKKPMKINRTINKFACDKAKFCIIFSVTSLIMNEIAFFFIKILSTFLCVCRAVSISSSFAVGWKYWFLRISSAKWMLIQTIMVRSHLHFCTKRVFNMALQHYELKSYYFLCQIPTFLFCFLAMISCFSLISLQIWTTSLSQLCRAHIVGICDFHLHKFDA